MHDYYSIHVYNYRVLISIRLPISIFIWLDNVLLAHVHKEQTEEVNLIDILGNSQ